MSKQSKMPTSLRPIDHTNSSFDRAPVRKAMNLVRQEDNEWIVLLHSIQPKLGSYELFGLLVENASYSPSPATP